MRVQMTKVWPLRTGIAGYTVDDRPITLPVLVPGFMVHEEALKAQEAGDVQIMAGLRPQDLKEPKLGPGRPRKNTLTKVMRAEKKGKKGKGSSSGAEEPAEKSHTYDRRDMVAQRAED